MKIISGPKLSEEDGDYLVLKDNGQEGFEVLQFETLKEALDAIAYGENAPCTLAKFVNFELKEEA